ncbi:MAG: FtsX-like permease family protein [Roseivirga sp.]|nr:FtsX-like permease family protein [Roseivirga sp.]
MGKNILPPKPARRFLEFYCKDDYLEEIGGDILELFEARLESKGAFKAKTQYYWDVMRFFRRSNIKKTTRLNSNITAMTRNNFKIAARILWRQKVNTTMNVMGIAIGIACFMLIALYVKQEVTFDSFHDKKDNIYRAWVKEVYDDGRIFNDITTPTALGPTLIRDIPEIEEFALIRGYSTLVGRGEGRISDNVQMVTSNFFKVFDFELLAGNTESPFSQLSHIVLSESYAKKYFGSSDPIGKTLSLEINDGITDYVVSAVVEDAPQNTSLPYNMLISYNDEELANLAGAQRGWFSIAPETYILLRDGTRPEDLEPKTRAMVKNTINGSNVFGDVPVEDHYLVEWQPLTDIHLNTEIPPGRSAVGNPQYVYILGAIGLLVMVIACINYTTLSIGQSFKRSKEVGMRKVVGAKSNSLIWQYLSESTLIALLATLFGVFFTFLMLPVFNELAQTNLILPTDFTAIGFALLLALIIGVLSGIYPALILARFKVISVLRGGSQSGGGKQLARKGMVVFQFLLTVFLISSTLIMRKQLGFLQSRDLGYEYNAMVTVPLYPSPEANRTVQRINTALENGNLLIGELSRNPDFSDFAMASHMFGTPGWSQIGFNADNGNYLSFNLLIVDANYLGAFDIKMAEGRDFDPSLESDKLTGVIINKAAAEYFGFENPIGAKLPDAEFGEHTIIGVTENFNYSSLHEGIEPLIMVQNPLPIFSGIDDYNSSDSIIPKLVFRYTGSNLTAVDDLLTPAWTRLFPSQELNFGFMEERLQNQYQNEARVNKIVTIATVLSILIASLGLLGLTILVVNTKIKEIGIRKVLGASPKVIFSLLFKGFSIQLLIAVLLSVPITWYLMKGWLEGFEYRIGMGADMFVVSALLALTIMLAVVSYHVIRASKANPVRALRTE